MDLADRVAELEKKIAKLTGEDKASAPPEPAAESPAEAPAEEPHEKHRSHRRRSEDAKDDG